MINDKLISLRELGDYIELIKLEQTFRTKLTLYNELKELELKFVGELKPLAEKLKMVKELSQNRGLIKDADLNRDIRNIINKKFVGGVDL